MTNATEIERGDRRRARRQLVLIALLFIAPVAVSFYLYYGNPWRPEGATHHGTLVTPPRPLPDVTLPTPSGGTTRAEFLRGDWSLVFAGGGDCDDRCQRALYEIRQVRLSLNQNMDRVQRVFLYTGTCCREPLFSTAHAGVIAANVDGEQGRALLEAMDPGSGADVLRAGRIHVVDPLGNLVLRYDPGSQPKGMIHDLKRLLKLSHIG